MNDTARAAIVLVIAALATLGGCSNPFRNLNSDYGPTPSPDQVRRIDSLGLESQRVQSPPDSEILRQEPPNPFEGLESMPVTLEQIRAWTLQNNLDLRVALIDPAIANETVSEEEAAWEAVFFSNLRISDRDQPTSSVLVGSETSLAEFDFGVRVPLRTGGEVTVRLPFDRFETNNAFSTLNPSFTADAEISISQPLLRGGGRRANTHALRVAALSEGISEARTKLEIIRQIAAADRAYWRLYAAREALEVAQQQYELAVAQLERSERRVRAGDVAEIEVVRSQEGVAQRLEGIIIAQNEVRLRQRELKRLVHLPGLDLNSPVMIETESAPAPAEYDFESDALVDMGIANRMELLELELQLAIDESSIAFERNRALPLFTVDYTYRLNGLGTSTSNAVDQLTSAEFDDWIFGLTGEIPIGNNAAKSRVQRSILERLQRLATRDARESQITQEVLDAIDNIDSGWQRILAASQTAILAARTLLGEQRQFDVGRRTSTDVLDAATRLADAQLAEIRAIVEYEIGKVDLAFATGTTLGAARVNWTPLDPREDDAGPVAFSDAE